MKSQTTLNIALMLSMAAALSMHAMDNNPNVGNRQRINALSSSDVTWKNLENQLKRINIPPTITHVISIAQLNELVKKSKCVMLGIADCSSQSGKSMKKTLTGSISKEDLETVYAYADLKTMPDLKQLYALTAPITIIEFANGEIVSRIPETNSNFQKENNEIQ